jgi:hypothetical protein
VGNIPWSLSQDLGKLNLTDLNYNNSEIPIDYNLTLSGDWKNSGTSKIRLQYSSGNLISTLKLNGEAPLETINKLSDLGSVSFWNNNDYFYRVSNSKKVYPDALYPVESFSSTKVTIKGRTLIGDISVSIPSNSTGKYWNDQATVAHDGGKYYTNPEVTHYPDDRVIVVKCPYTNSQGRPVHVVNFSDISVTLKAALKDGSDSGVSFKGELGNTDVLDNINSEYRLRLGTSDRVSNKENDYLKSKGIPHLGYNEKTLEFSLFSGSEPVFIKRDQSGKAESTVSYRLIFAVISQTASLSQKDQNTNINSGNVNVNLPDPK